MIQKLLEQFLKDVSRKYNQQISIDLVSANIAYSLLEKQSYSCLDKFKDNAVL